MQIRDKDDTTSEDYIIQDNKKTRVGTTIIVVTLVILIVGIIISGIYFEFL